MAVNNTNIDVRIRQKYDTIENFITEDAVYLESELLFAQLDEIPGNIALFLGDGTSRFSQLKPFFTTRQHTDTPVKLVPVQILASEWQDNMVIKEVLGVSENEASQLIIPAWANDSRVLAQNCGVDFYVEGENLLTFTTIDTPEEDMIVYIGILERYMVNIVPITILTTDWVGRTALKEASGVLDDESSQLLIPAWSKDSKFIARSCEVDFVVTQDNQIEFTCDNIPTQNLTVYIAVLEKLQQSKKKLLRVTIPFETNVNGVADGYASKVITHATSINRELLFNAYWSGKGDNGSFFGNYPVIIQEDNSIILLNMPVLENEYNITGQIVLEYKNSVNY